MKLGAIAIFIFLFLLHTTAVYAVDVPSFSNCPNPGGTLSSHYDDGSHGIVGDMATHIGSDSVFTIDDQKLVQCFCPTEGQGVQTNWWKIGNMSQSEIDSLTAQGWIYIPSGNVWGLSGSSYLAFNTSVSCSTNGSSTSATSNNDSGSNSNSSSSNKSNDPGGVTAAASLSLANTGNMPLLLSLLLSGFGLLLLAFLLQKKLRN